MNMRLLWLTMISSSALLLHAAAQSDDDPTAVPQLSKEVQLDENLPTATQLNTTEPLDISNAEVLQIVPPSADFGVAQAEGGRDLCEQGGARSEICNREPMDTTSPNLAKDPRLPEEDFIAGSPSSIDRFSRDPSITADQIGRGVVSTLAAQSFADELLNKQQEEDPEAALSPLDLPPDILQTYQSGTPSPTQGN